ncbi:MAG: ATP-binding protein [Sodaliphilus sp.]
MNVFLHITRLSSPAWWMRCFVLAVVCCCASLSAAHAAPSIESLYRQYAQAQNAQKEQLARQLQKLLIDEEYVEAEFFTDKKYKGMEEATILMGVSSYFYYADQYAEAEKVGLKAIELLDKVENDLKSDTYSILGCSMQRMGNLPKALEYMQKGLDIDTKIGDKERMGSDMNTITGIYLTMNDPKSAEQYILKAIRLQKSVHGAKPSTRLGIQLGMASEVYLKLKDYNKSLKYANEALANDTKNGDSVAAAVRQCQVAAALYELRRYDDAEPKLRSALPVLIEAKKNNSLAICYAQLADIMRVKHNDAEAVTYFEKALEICTAIGNRYLERRCERGMAEALGSIRPAEALKHWQRHTELADSIFNEELARQSNIFNAKYKNEELQAQNAQMESTNRVFRIAIVATIICLCLLIVLAVALYVMFKQKSRAHIIAHRLEQARTSFFTNITHEFRTPLTVILGASERLMKGNLAPDEEPATLYAMILRQGKGLLRLINQLLDISKVNSEIGNPDWRHGDVVPLISMVVSNFKDAAYQKGIHLRFATKQHAIEMDFVPDYLQKIISNLISNAIKFTNADGTVAITAEAKRHDICIRVADNGRGIPKEDLPGIFDAFQQASNGHDKVGSGVGLALVKQIVNSMKGEIRVSSSVEKGTVFTILLPLDQALKTPAKPVVGGTVIMAPDVELDEAAPHPGAPNTEHHHAKPSVLLVEDDPDISYYIGSQLANDYNVHYAANGEEGFAMAGELMPALIITDLMMPVCDGYSLCQRLQASEALNHIPVIILTAKSDDADKIKALQLGVDNFMSKPFSSEELELRVNHLIQQREALRRKFSVALAQGDDPEVNFSEPERLFLEKFNAIIEEKMQDGEVDIENMASALCMSPKQLRSKMASITGETPSSYVQKLRLKKACQLLKHTDLQIGEIAMQCGFDDSAYFSRLFKQVHNLTPTQYRKK